QDPNAVSRGGFLASLPERTAIELSLDGRLNGLEAEAEQIAIEKQRQVRPRFGVLHGGTAFHVKPEAISERHEGQGNQQGNYPGLEGIRLFAGSPHQRAPKAL
ncbi:hypothetical protein, partial [Pseudomonas gessardii]|uniref:hypothetical protein n=1 Tax=Pseudomonas gessardii TaxID=78544 RepID=UPI002E2F0D3C